MRKLATFISLFARARRGPTRPNPNPTVSLSPSAGTLYGVASTLVWCRHCDGIRTGTSFSVRGANAASPSHQLLYNSGAFSSAAV